VQAVVERVGHLPGVGDQDGVFVGGAIVEVGRQRVGGHRDRVPGVLEARLITSIAGGESLEHQHRWV